MAFALPRMSHNLVSYTLKKVNIARQFRQHHREPYDLRQLGSVGIRSRIHGGVQVGIFLSTIGAIDGAKIQHSVDIAK